MDLSTATLFALSLLALALGPLVYGAARVAGCMLAALDGFAFVAIAGLVVLHIVPEGIALAGWLSVAAVAVGIWLPTLMEHRLGSLAHRVHTITLVLGLVAVGAHAFLDGLALGGGDAGDHAHMLPMAVVVHRLPVGLTVWFLLRPLYGRRLAAAALALMAGATTAGFLFGGLVVAAVESRVWGLVQALVAGSLLHVVLHRSYPVAPDSEPLAVRRWPSGLGALAGLALLWMTAVGHHLGPTVTEGVTVFVALARRSAPALLLAYATACLVHAARACGTGRGLALDGLPLALRSDEVLPLHRWLVGAGVPATVALAVLLAAPGLSLDALFISVPLLGVPFTTLRVAAVAFVALLTGWALARVAWRPAAALGGRRPAGAAVTRRCWPGRLRWGLQRGLGEGVDGTAPWVLAGLALAAVAQSLVGSAWQGLVPTALQVAVFALLGIPVYLCASAATPVVAVLIHNGVSPGAGLAFLLTGSAAGRATVTSLTRLVGRRAALGGATVVVLLSLGLGHAVNALWGSGRGIPMPTLENTGSLGSDVALAVVALLFLQSLVRQGPRAFVGELFEADGHGGAHHHEAARQTGGDGATAAPRRGPAVAGTVAAVEEP